jgi:predicted transposase YbfD/YdcC
MIEALTECQGKTTRDRRHCLSSAKLDAATFARAVGGHWGIGDRLHWMLD